MKIPIDVTLDGRTWACPRPIAETKRCLETLASGQVIHLMTRDKSTHLDLLALLAIRGDALLRYEQEAGVHLFWIQKK